MTAVDVAAQKIEVKIPTVNQATNPMEDLEEEINVIVQGIRTIIAIQCSFSVLW